MEYRTLGDSGLKVSRACLGTMPFGTRINESEAEEMVELALERDVNFFDTADVYPPWGEGSRLERAGRSEEILGKALEDYRDEVVLASKVRSRVGKDEFKDSGLHRWHIIDGVEKSLERLNTDCLDILYFHRPDYDTSLEESIAAVDQLIRDGKVMYWGLSNYAAWQACEILWICDRRNFRPPIVIQYPYNLLTRGIEQECLPFSEDQNIGITVYNPLAGGLLTGKHEASKGPKKGTRFDVSKIYNKRYWRESFLDATGKLVKIADGAGLKPVQLALRWVSARDEVDSVILGATKKRHLEENIDALEGELSEDVLESCNKLWDGITQGDNFQYNR